MKWRGLMFTVLVAIFVVPYVSVLVSSGFSFRLPVGFFELVATSILQAVCSAVVALIFGLLGALGLLRRSARWETVAIAPAVVPAIALVLGFLTVFPQWRGWSAVVFAHALSSAGLVAVVLVRQIRGALGASLELAWTEGASRTSMWIRGVLPALREDLLRLGLTVFAASLTSFSIPLILGGSKAVTLEIAIHQAVRLDSAWDIAATLSLFQWSFLLILIFVLKAPSISSRRAESELRIGVGRMLGFDVCSVFLVLAPAISLYALLSHPRLGLIQLQSAGLVEHASVFGYALMGSFVTSTLAGLLVILVLLLFTVVFPSERQRLWLSGYVAPSVAIIGFAMLTLGGRRDPSFALDCLRIAFGAALLFSPVLWRLRVEQRLAQLEGQVLVAQTLGASHLLTVLRVLWPQMKETLFWSAAMTSFWVWGDYALGSIAASNSMTLGLLAKSLLESYRLEAASLVTLACLVSGGFSYWLFTVMGGSADVAGKSA